jgi:hypothetical protein
LSEEGCHIGADPLFGEEAVVEAVELVADVVDAAAGGGDASELTLVGAAEGHADRDFILSGDEVVDVCPEVGGTQFS